MIYTYEEQSGQINMEIDRTNLDRAIEQNNKEAIFRLYGWKPACVSLGRNQKDDFLDYDKLKKLNIDVVRRITGGKALFHNNEVTYSFICPVNLLNDGENVISSYKEISNLLILAFSKLGIELDYGLKKRMKNANDYCMMLATGADLCYKGKKLIGSAQCRKQGYILQHGSILYDYDKTILKNIFNDCDNFDNNITSIKSINPKISKEDVIQSLLDTAKNLFRV